MKLHTPIRLLIRTAFVLSLFLFLPHVFAQKISVLEYFIDKDPGVGKASSVSFSGPTDTLIKNFTVPIVGLKDGQHFLYIRTKTDSSLWSPWQMQLFFVDDTTTTGNIEQVEYFLDKDPDVSKASNLNITPSSSVNQIIQLNSSNLLLGRHYIHVRAKTLKGLWSPWQFQMFFIEDTTVAKKINQIEYFIGKEPGVGKATNISITPADSIELLLNRTLSNLSEGRNFIHCRAKINIGMWSPWQFQMFFINDTVRPGPIEKVEYFIDKNPGVGKAIPVSISAADTIKKQININSNNLTLGRHYVHVRSLNRKGLWSPWQFQMFYVEEKKDTGKITQFYYRIDSSLNNNKGKVVFLNPISDTLRKTLYENTDTALNLGRHYFRIWTLQNNRFRSTWHFDTFDIINCPMLDTAIIKLPVRFCKSDSLIFKQDVTRLGVWPKDSFNFKWKINGTQLSTLDSLKYKHNTSNSFVLNFSFTKKSESRCKGELIQTITVFDAPKDTTKKTICLGDSIRIHGIWRKANGTYDFNGASFRSCDSFSRVILTVNPTYKDTIRVNICSGDSIKIHNVFRKTTGTYFYNGKSVKACDSLVWVFLKVNPKYFKSDTFNLCAGDTLKRHNKKFVSAGLYKDTLKSIFGCDSVFNTLINIKPKYNDTFRFSICNGDSILIHSIWRKNAGTFVLNAQSKFGCDSIVTCILNIKTTYNINNSIVICSGDSALIHGRFRKTSGLYTNKTTSFLGCDSTVNTTLIVHPSYQIVERFTICNGDSIVKHGRSFKTAGTYISHFKTYQNCDSIYQTTIIVNPTYHLSRSFGICSNDSFLFDGKYRQTTGIYVGNFKTTNGCDSIVTLNLKVDNVINTNDFPVICEGDSILIGGTYRKQAGNYQDRYTAIKGCDSIVTRHLSINKRDTTLTSAFICYNGSLNYHGFTFNDTGVYKVVLRNIKACDSIVFIRIKKRPVTINSFSKTVCFGEGTFVGKSVKFGSGVFRDTLTDFNGCDSVIIYTQTERLKSTGNVAFSVCQGDSIFNGKTWKNKSGIYLDTVKNHLGCDSFLTTNITVLPVSNTDIFDTICHGDFKQFFGDNITRTGDYIKTLNKVNGCDSVITLHLYKRPQFIPRVISISFSKLSTDKEYSSYQWYLNRTIVVGKTKREIDVTNSGIYDVSVIDSLGCSANSWDNLTDIGSVESDWPIVAYPNPADQYITFKASKPSEIKIYNGIGVLIDSKLLTEGENILNTSELSDGVYYIYAIRSNQVFRFSIVVIH